MVREGTEPKAPSLNSPTRRQAPSHTPEPNAEKLGLPLHQGFYERCNLISFLDKFGRLPGGHANK